MRLRLPLLAVLAATVPADPAAAAPVTVPAQGAVPAGPELPPGGGVVWGEEQRGALVVRARDAAGAVSERVRLPALEAPRSRLFGQLGSVLAVTDTWLGFVEIEQTVRSSEGDSSSLSSTSVVRAGRPDEAGPPVVAGPPGGDADVVAADGPVLAYAVARLDPGGSASIVVRGPEGTRTFTASRREARIRRLHVAGRFVSWSVEPLATGGRDARVVVADRRTGRVVLRVTPRRGLRFIDDHDLRPDGTVALLVRSGLRPFRTDLAVASPARPMHRVLRRGVSGTRVEVAGGRAAVALLDERTKEHALVVVPLRAGAPARVVARFPRGRSLLLRRFAFDGRRVAWAEADVDYYGEAYDTTPTRVQVRDVPAQPPAG